MNKLRVNKGFAMERFSILCIVILITGCQAAGKCGYEVCITRFRQIADCLKCQIKNRPLSHVDVF